MQFGLPVIVSDRVGCRIDLVEPEKTGLVFASGDAESLAACVSRLMGDPENARAMGAAGRRRISAFTTAEAVRGILAAIGMIPASLLPPVAVAVG
jgi:glycosyltransferase involved in cell wall biosynthesis